MDILLTIINSMAVTGSILSILWLWRVKKTLTSPFGIFAVVAFAFTVTQFILLHDHTHVSMFHEIIAGLFAIVAIGMNTYCASYAQKINIGIERRTTVSTSYQHLHKDRRQNSSKIIQMSK